MGMFNTVICEYPLPDKYIPPEGNFQTKNLFESTLDWYKISREGRLYSFGTYIDSIGTSLDYTIEVKPLYHGIFNFYDYERLTGRWYSYQACFTHGHLEYIEIASDHWFNRVMIGKEILK